MGLGEIWDYMMRRKILLLFLFAVSMLGGLGLGHIMAKQQVASSFSHEPARNVVTTKNDTLSQSELVQLITQYQNTVTPEVITNKKLDTAKKTQIFQAYEQLNSENQAKFADFIQQLQRGGSPEIRFSGQTTYEIGAETPIFARMVELYDNEDGDETGQMSKAGLKVVSNLNTERAGTYYATMTMRDSDGNQSELTVDLEVKDSSTMAPAPDDTNQPSVTPPADQQPDLAPNDPSTGSSLGNVSVGGGINIGDTGLTDKLPTPGRGDTETTVFDQSEIDSQIALNGTADGPVALLPAESQTREPATTLANSTNPAAATGWSAWNILWIGLGLLAAVVFIRFIFDHYVR